MRQSRSAVRFPVSCRDRIGGAPDHGRPQPRRRSGGCRRARSCQRTREPGCRQRRGRARLGGAVACRGPRDLRRGEPRRRTFLFDASTHQRCRREGSRERRAAAADTSRGQSGWRRRVHGPATDTDHWAACRTRALAVRPISFARSAGTAPALWSRVGAPSTSYEPRHPAQGLLYQIVRDHFETVRAQAVSLRDGEGLPRFVEQEFRAFLQCGWLAGGFALRLSSAASPISSRTSAAPTPIATVAPGVSGRDWPWWSPRT
jgi:hypothetical protein